MEHDSACDAVLNTAEASEAIRHWIVGRSAEAVEVREQLESIIQFFGDLDAAIDSLDPGSHVNQLSRLVRAEMVQDLLLDASKILQAKVAPSPATRSDPLLISSAGP